MHFKLALQHLGDVHTLMIAEVVGVDERRLVASVALALLLKLDYINEDYQFSLLLRAMPLKSHACRMTDSAEKASDDPAG